MHEVETKKLAVHMGELQRAHLQQNRVVRELEEAVARVPVLKKTVRNQQQVIVSLEGLLRRAVVEVKDLKAGSAQAAAALEAATSARDIAEAAKASAETATAQAEAKAEHAMSLSLQAGKSKAKEPGLRKAPAPPTATSSLPVRMPTLGHAESTPATTVQSLPAPVSAPTDVAPSPAVVRSPKRTPEEVVVLRKELSRVKEKMTGLEQAAQEARAKEQEAVKAAAAASAAAQAAVEQAKQAEEAAQAADNDLLEVWSVWVSVWVAGLCAGPASRMTSGRSAGKWTC